MAVDNEDELPRNIRWELGRLRTCPAIDAESLSYERSASDTVTIKFDFFTDLLLEPTETKIEDVESIVLRYHCEDLVGQVAPEVLSGRGDFPRDLPHLNPTPANRPASLCLARSGLQPIYDALGIYGVIQRLGEWMSDAKTETLYEDGWDPVPAVNTGQVLGLLNAEYLQELAAKKPEGGRAFIVARVLLGQDGPVFVNAADDPVDTDCADARRIAIDTFRGRNLEFGPDKSIPCIFLWPSKDEIEERPVFTSWCSFENLVSGLKEIHLFEPVEDAFVTLDVLFNQDQREPPELDRNGNRGILLIIGVWRPAPLDRTIVGLSKDDEARSLELRGYYLQRNRHDKDRWSNQSALKDFYGFMPATRDVLESVSGETCLPAATIIGAGALGSAFIDYALRAGCKPITVIDRDRLASHNVARHSGLAPMVGQPKTDIAKLMAQHRGSDLQVIPKEFDILTVSVEQFLDSIESRELLIDATADARVRRFLSSKTGADIPIFRAEIFHKGALGVGIWTRMGGHPNLTALFYQLIALAYSNSHVREWLAYESTQSFLDEELRLGLGCTSATTKLPAYKVTQHASALYGFMKSRLAASAPPAIALNSLNSDGTPCGIQVIEPEPIVAFESGQGTSGWQVKVAQCVQEKIHSLRRGAAPIETGGYLYGGISEALSEIYVVACSDEPPDTKATPTSLDLGPAGGTGYEKALIRRTAGRLGVVGSWHAHPTSNAEASERDWETASGFRRDDRRLGFPTLMFITGMSEDRAYVLED